MNNNTRAYIAEFLGTFILVFLGCAAVWATSFPGYGAGPLVPALAHGFAVVMAVYSFGNISGAHLNPAVSFGFALSGAISWGRALAYAGVQVLAGIVAAFVLSLLVGRDQVGRFGAFYLGGTGVFAGLFTELILTFILVTVILKVSTGGKVANTAGIVVGLTLIACILGGSLITGASLNPARTIGPALMNLFSANTPADRAVDIVVHLVAYIAGPILGALLAAVVERYVLPNDR